MRKKTTPSPVAVTTICSVCGLGWEAHGLDPSTDDCIKLLKAALASRPMYRGYWYQQPTVTYPAYPNPTPWINYSGGVNQSSGSIELGGAPLNTQTPRTISGTVTPAE